MTAVALIKGFAIILLVVFFLAFRTRITRRNLSVAYVLSALMLVLFILLIATFTNVKNTF